MLPENHKPSELQQQQPDHVPEGSGDPGPSRPPDRADLAALLAILAAGTALVLAGHLSVTDAITLLTALLGLYAMYRKS